MMFQLYCIATEGQTLADRGADGSGIVRYPSFRSISDVREPNVLYCYEDVSPHRALALDLKLQHALS